MEDDKSISLLQLMAKEGLMVQEEEEGKRGQVIEKLKKMVMEWVKRVAWQRGLPKEEIVAASATVLASGSYGIGAHVPDSDICAVCVGPSFANMNKDFFVVLRNKLESTAGVFDVQCVKTAQTQSMRFKFDGISVNLSYARLKVLTVPDDVGALDPTILGDVDEISWKSLSAFHVNHRILQLVPNLKEFRSLLKSVKFWAKRRGVYGSLNGFPGGVHYAVLAAYVCQSHPDSSLSALVSNFFTTFATWSWPKPVALQDGMSLAGFNEAFSQLIMPICLPRGSHGYFHSIVTRNTFYKIRSEFLRGHNLTKDLLKPNFTWAVLFEPFMYSKNYTRFIKMVFSASKLSDLEDWVGWAKSHFRSLLLKLEELQGSVDPNAIEWDDPAATEPNIVFFWGLNPGRNAAIDINSLKEHFSKILSTGYHGTRGKVDFSIAQTSELPKEALLHNPKRKKTKAQWKILEYHQQRRPMYSQHLPSYFVGHSVGNLISDRSCYQ